MNGYFHSVALCEDKCRGCTNCISTCPTEAIRVRKGKARIILERCIDCGECIRTCPSNAKIADTDPLNTIGDYDFTVAVPAPSLYGQFPETFTQNHILTALKRLGFDNVFEAAAAAELVAAEVRKYAEFPGREKPVISSSCPAVVRLIQVRFPSLLEQVAKIKAPIEIAGSLVRKIHGDKKNLGIFFITPCPAKRTSIKASLSTEKSSLDGAIAVKDLYISILHEAGRIQYPEELATAGTSGIGWAGSDGEALSVGIPRTLTVDGIHRVIEVLELVENGELKDFDFIEAMSCPGGCVGGPLNAVNAALARTRIRGIAQPARKSSRIDTVPGLPEKAFFWEKDLPARPVLKLDENIGEALEKVKEIDRLTLELPGLDCGACGSPSCRSLAEDIVRGTAEETDCVFVLRERIRNLTLEMVKLEEKLPPSFSPSEENGL